MRKRMRQTNRMLSGILTLACLISSVGINGMTVSAAEKAVPDIPWISERYELEDGRTFLGEGSTRDFVIKSDSRFSKGKAIDTMDKNGNGAGVEVEPDITEESVYQVVLGYMKGIAYKEGRIALYKNDDRVDYFKISSSENKVKTADPIPVHLQPGDRLSIRSDTGNGTDAVANFDYLDVRPWGGVFEAENGSFLLNSMKVKDMSIASGNKLVDGFAGDGAGIRFPFTIPEDNTYILTLGYNRIQYEQKDQIGIYVGEERIASMELIGRGNTDEIISDSDPLELALKAGDELSVRVSEKDGDKGLLELDYLQIKPKPVVEEIHDDPAFTSALLCVLKGDTLTVPVKNVPRGVKLTYSSSDEDVAAVDSASGKITAQKAGKVVITAQAKNISFSCRLIIVDKEDELTVPAARYEAEEGELVAGDKDKLPEIKSGSPFSGGKWVEIYNSGTGAAVKISPRIEEEGEYQLTMSYAKGSMYDNDTVSVYVNSTKIGDFKMYSGDVNKPRDTNTLTASLKPGDKVMVRKDEGQNSLFRYDCLLVSPVMCVPVRGIQMNQNSLELVDKESVKAPYTLSPAGATDDLIWSSSDPTIAEADGGYIRGRNVGTAVITARSPYNDAVKATLSVTVTANNKLITLSSEDMEVVLDKTFPRVLEYRMTGSGNTMDGNLQALDTMLVNGKSYKPEVTFEKGNKGDSGVYTIAVKELDALLTLQAKVEGTILKFDFLDIRESEDEAKRIFSFEFPGMNPVSVSSREESAQFAGSRMEANIARTGDEYIDLTGKGASAPGNYLYAFISNGKVAAGIRSNAYAEGSSAERIIMETVSEGAAYRTSLRSDSWLWRRADYTKKFVDYEGTYGEKGQLVTNTYKDTPNRKDMPLFYIVLAEDLNNSGTVDWQDAAIRFRDVMQTAVGMDMIPDAVVQRLIMPQAGEGNYPFISSLDETKRMYLNTDGLGQIILNKFHNLGYWGDFSVYDDHLGGLQDFNKFVDSSTNEYNGFVGVHTNFTQAFAKTNQFSMESIAVKDGGLQPNTAGYKAFGFFLHQSYTADDTWEAMTGERRDAMALFKKDVPDLGFIYSDVYSYGGWRGQRLAEDYTANGLAYFVEWPYLAEDTSVWSHWAVEKSYSPASNKGYASDIARFIFNHTKDRWDNNASQCDNERHPNSCNLLMGADTTSYEGWVHDGVNRFDYVIEKVFDNNLPTKYMQHFPILRMDKDENGWGEHIWFENGLEVFLDKDGRRTMTQNGRLLYNQDSYLLPWDEGDMQKDNSQEAKEVKLYHWNEKGGTTTWKLPDSWKDLGSVYLYRLTDQGKVDEKEITVNNGSITLENMGARVPYVLYKGQAAPTEDVKFGDGTFVKDPGFNYGDLREWSLDYGTAQVHRNDTEGDDNTTQSWYQGDLRNYELVIDSSEAAQVSQTVTGLVPGQEYAASVMVEVEQGKEREASIQVDCGDSTVKNYTTRSILKQYDAYDSKASTYMLRMRVVFQVPEGETTAKIRLCAAEGDGKIRFDNVRVYDTTTPQAPEDAVNVVLYQDFEYGKRDNAPVRAENKVTYESYYPFNLGAAGGIREARAMLQTRHDPYTQNNTNSHWDRNTIWVDMALDGDNSLSVITDTLGAAFQTTPQSLRFEKGHTYRITFLYQNALDDTFAFVLGAGQNSNPIYQEKLKATPEKTGNKTFTYEFTSESDQTWFSINRVDRSVTVSDNPNPFVIDNLLVEDLSVYPITVIDNEDAVITAPKESPAGAEVKFTVEAAVEGKEVSQVSVSSGDSAEDSVGVEVRRDSEKEYSFTMPADAVTISVEMKDKKADRTGLAAAIDLAGQKLESSYTAESWMPFAEALAAAKAVNDREAAGQGEVDKALEDLMAAMKQLVRLQDKADKSVLNAVLGAALMKEQGLYTAESWSLFKEALIAARTVAEDVAASQNTINGARLALTEAMARLTVEAVEESVDLSLLQAVIHAAGSEDGANYTEDSYSAVVDAKEKAEVFMDVSSGDVSQGDANAVAEGLKGAIFGLVPREEGFVSRILLDVLKAFAGSRQEADYTTESWAVLAQARDAAETVPEDAAQADVNTAADALCRSLANLKKKTGNPPVDWGVLNALITLAEGKQEADYSHGSFQAMKEALESARSLKQDADQRAADIAAADLAAGLEQLAAPVTANKTALDLKIGEARMLKQEDYTQESFAALKSALAAAELVSADPDAEQSRVDEALAKLEEVIKALKPAEGGNDGDDPDDGKPDDGDPDDGKPDDGDPDDGKPDDGDPDDGKPDDGDSNDGNSDSGNHINDNGGLPQNIVTDWKQVRADVQKTGNSKQPDGTVLNIVTGSQIVVPTDVLKTLKEQKATLALHTGRGLTFSISGSQAAASLHEEKLDLSVREGTGMIPSSVMNLKLQGTLDNRKISMVNEGDFGMTVNMHLSLGSANAGRYANLYRYNRQTGGLLFLGTFQITGTGQAMFGIRQGGEFLVTLTRERTGEKISAANGQTVVVVRGDTLSGIAARYGVRLADLVAANPQINDMNRIKPGEKIVIR